MKNLILLYLVISFCLVNCVFCYTQTDDLIASSYDWGKKRIDNLANTQGIRVTAGEVTTCFDDPQIIKCVVTNIGSDDLYIDSMANEKNFEDALERLEKIVKKLEEGDLTLDESMRLFEEGIKQD